MRNPDFASIRDACSEPYGFWLDSAMAGGTLGQRSFWGAEPAVVLRSWGRSVEIERRRGGTSRFEGDPFDALRDLLSEWRHNPQGAAVGYLGYGLKRHIERLPDTVDDDLGVPECHLAFYDRMNVIEPHSLAPPPPVPGSPPKFCGLQSNFTRDAYESSVRRALEYIEAGDVYQVNLSQRFQAACTADPFDVYLCLRAQSPAPFGAYLKYPEYDVLSSSPERFLRYEPRGRTIETRPIKGTRPRGVCPDSDRALALELLVSEKDRAENLMIVDLERNDLGRVAEIGSVTVDRLI